MRKEFRRHGPKLEKKYKCSQLGGGGVFFACEGFPRLCTTPFIWQCFHAVALLLVPKFISEPGFKKCDGAQRGGNGKHGEINWYKSKHGFLTAGQENDSKRSKHALNSGGGDFIFVLVKDFLRLCAIPFTWQRVLPSCGIATYLYQNLQFISEPPG
mmetsp:Transcript_22810/g.47386  ORF Transcript_22810/g.47386 Transcript_22810/m.47386 type:complete len:156 (-) Transcript_22810:441-908(-)